MISFSAAISACKVDGHVQLVAPSLRRCEELDLLLDVISFSAAIFACEVDGCTQRVAPMPM
eukprot:4060891-Karenia_brevis.AAC.1